MVENRIDRFPSAVDELDDAGRKAGGQDQMKQFPGRHRDALGGFQQEAVSAGHRVGQEPERNHAREIKRHHGGDHAQRLPDHVFVDARSDVLGVDALHQRGHAAGGFDVFDGAAELGDALGVGLAAFVGDGAGQVLDIGFEENLQLKQRLDAIADRRASPSDKGPGRGLDGAVDFLARRQRHFGQNLGGRGIENGERLTGGRSVPAAINEVW